MVKITKEEAFKLRELGLGQDVSMTKSRYTHYYMTESPKAVPVLKDIRDGGIVRIGSKGVSIGSDKTK